MRFIAAAGLVAMMMLATGCSSTSDEGSADLHSNETADQRDPLEGINRPVWDFNWKVLDKHLLRPAAVGYAEYVPTPVKSGLLNVANNLDEPFTLINEVLQLKLVDAGVTTGRFLLNSTVGLFGLIDVAGHLGIDRTDEDFAQTLGVWGVGQGAFLMWPGLGPSTLKDTTGNVVDSLAFSFNLLSWPESLLKVTVQTLDTRYALIDQEALLNDSLDPYSFTKEAYLQRQKFKQYDGNVPDEADDLDLDDLDLDDLE